MIKDKQDNRGFTLIEILLSIVLLAILILPALCGFISAARINKEADNTQVATELAQNVMESVKDMTIEDMAFQFYGKDSLYVLRNNYVFDSYTDGGYGEYTYTIPDNKFIRVTATDPSASVKITSDGTSSIYSYIAPPDRKKLYFGIKNVKAGNSEYDAVITMNATKYSDPKYSDSMNNYKMPRLIDLDQDAVAVIDLEGMTTTWSDDSATAYIKNKNSKDEQIINDFININKGYIAKLKSQPVPEGTTVSYPNEIKRDLIISNIHKKIIIHLTKDTDLKKVIVKCTLLYTCNLDLNGDSSGETLSMEVLSGAFPIPKNETVESSVYLFYTPSIFSDTIEIENSGAVANVSIVKQNATPKVPVKINCIDSVGSTTKIYTNLKDSERDSSSVINNNIYELENAKNRIYNINVSVYHAGTIASGSLGKELVTLTSTGEE